MKITWFSVILTSGLINLTMVTMATSIGLLTSKQKKSKINHLWCSESITMKGFEVLFCLYHVQIYLRVVPKA